MSEISRKELEELRGKLKKGTVVRLVKMNDTQAPPIGTKGIIEHIDDTGTIFCRWENGSGLGLVYGEDEYEVVKEG